MASSSNLVYLSFFFILLTTLQTHARDSYVFSKVSRNRDDTTLPSNTLYNNNENEVSPSFEQQKVDEEQPSFVPQTTHSNYGLYGHETSLNDNNYKNRKNFNNQQNVNENQNYYNNNENIDENVEFSDEESKYVPQLSESSYTNDVGPTKYVAQNDLNNNNSNDNDDGNGEGKYYGSTKYNGRKNFYDVDGETKFDAYLKNMELSYSKNHNNNFNKNGKLYGNNYYNGNAMNQGYRNEFPQDEEFDFDDQP